MANLGAEAEGLLEASYDCLDRGVFNAYFGLGQTPGGFRAWWRALFGSDDELDEAHLMRLAGRFARRAEAWAKKANVPFIRCEKGERKHEIARDYLPSDPNFQGVFCVLVARAYASVWQVQRYGNGGINIKRKSAFVNHYSFHIIDREWGHFTIKICGHAPYFTQVMINGHEFVARQLQQEGIEFTQEENCFTETSNAAGLSRCAETSCQAGAIGRLRQLCERWIYSACLCFALSEEERQRSGFRYDYSWYQAEYSRNLLFAHGARMEQFIQDLIDRVRQRLDLRTLKTLFGRKQRPQTRCRKRLEQSLERPVYDLTVFKVHWGRLTLKVYTKGERLTRIEAIVHNTAELKCRRSLEYGAEILSQLRGMLDRFCETLESVSRPWISNEALDELPEPTQMGERRIAGIDLNRARMRAVVESVLALATRPGGFQAEHLAERVSERLQVPYSSRQASYDLKKLRAKGLVEKQPQSRRYAVSAEKLRPLTALLVIREHVLRPVVARSGQRPTGGNPATDRPAIDQHYDRLQIELEALFQTLHLTV
jgi:DNA-binding transcriptional ArsR family regulator